MTIKKQTFSTLCYSIVTLMICLAGAQAHANEINILDSLGNHLSFHRPPAKVISLVPSATEILFELGADKAVAGLTYHDATLKGAEGKPVVGGFFMPSVEKVEALDPDLVILSDLQKEMAAALKGKGCALFFFDTQSIDHSFENILTLGRLFDKEEAARAIVGRNKSELDLIRRKLARIPVENRKRVARFMGRSQVMTPGNDSFQNEIIRLAGGIPPDFGKAGGVVPVSGEEWQAFNPQVIYGCGGDKKAAGELFSRDSWKNVDAVKNHQCYYHFPCELTCRAATHTGYFASWLASVIYTEEFARTDQALLPLRRIASEPVAVDLPYVKSAGVHTSTILDFNNKTLLVEFKRPQAIVSTLEGERSGILAVGNHFFPPPAWMPGHHTGIENIRSHVLSANGKDRETTAFLITGADMGNLGVGEKSYKEMRVTALATAGVLSNAVRMSRDIGLYYEPGTVNIIVMTNMKLSGRAMTRAVISATEAKTAVMEDMDIRSTAAPLPHPATGTGTDNILVVQGEGTPIENSGGHSKMGELIARAVYDAVTKAIFKQNKITARRHIFQRLKERKISLFGLTAGVDCECMDQENIEKHEFSKRVEHLLLEPAYAGFLESALALSDAYDRGLVKDLSLFNGWCRAVASGIAARPVENIESLVAHDDMPLVLDTAFNALFTGVLEQLRNE